MAIYGAHQREGVSCMSDVARGRMRSDRRRNECGNTPNNGYMEVFE